MGDEHANGLGVKGDKAVRVLPDVVHYAVQPCLCLHQDENLAEQYENIISIQIEGKHSTLETGLKLRAAAIQRLCLNLSSIALLPGVSPTRRLPSLEKNTFELFVTLESPSDARLVTLATFSTIVDLPVPTSPRRTT